MQDPNQVRFCGLLSCPQPCDTRLNFPDPFHIDSDIFTDYGDTLRLVFSSNQSR
jgi:hypothetical protein